MGQSTHGHVPVRTAFVDLDDCSFKDLNALSVSFDNLCMHPDGVSGEDVGNVVFQLLLTDGVK
jgi:hypothetical protein